MKNPIQKTIMCFVLFPCVVLAGETQTPREHFYFVNSSVAKSANGWTPLSSDLDAKPSQISDVFYDPDDDTYNAYIKYSFSNGVSGISLEMIKKNDCQKGFGSLVSAGLVTEDNEAAKPLPYVFNLSGDKMGDVKARFICQKIGPLLQDK